MATDLADLTAWVATHEHTACRILSFYALRIVFAPGKGWSQAQCHVLHANGTETVLPCRTLNSISSNGAPFPVHLIGPDGTQHAPLSAQGLMTTVPAGADCFLLLRAGGGLWEGVTVTAAFSRLTIRSYAFDPH